MARKLRVQHPINYIATIISIAFINSIVTITIIVTIATIETIVTKTQKKRCKASLFLFPTPYSLFPIPHSLFLIPFINVPSSK